jgi:hypothetical protein
MRIDRVRTRLRSWLSQQGNYSEISRRTGIHRIVIASWINKEVWPSAESLFTLRNKMGLDINNLVDRAK